SSALAVGARVADSAVTTAMLPTTTAACRRKARISMMVPFPGRRAGGVENDSGCIVVVSGSGLYRRLGGGDLLAPIGHGQRDRAVLCGNELELDKVVRSVGCDPHGGWFLCFGLRPEAAASEGGHVVG